jgi:type IV pilus assembly protein PilW
MSLVELMVAMAISLVLLGAMAGIFVSNSRARNEIENSSRQIENGRYAAEIVSDDLRAAGFYGELNVGSIDTSTTTLPADPCSLTLANWIAAIPVHLQGYSNVAAAPGSCVLPDLKTGTDIVVVRRVQTCLAGVDGCEAEVAGRSYLQVSMCNTLPLPLPVPAYLLTPQSTAATLLLKDCATPVARRRYLVDIYYIGTDNGAGVSVPTLKRLELNGAAWTITPLVEGIEQLHFEYGIDNDNDGAPDTYSSNPATVANWMNVMTVHFFILARNIDASVGYLDSKTYQLGSLAIAAPNDGYRRHVYSGLVRISNPAGRRDTP